MWKYNNLDETQLKLLPQGIIDLQGDVDGDMALYVREALVRLRAHTEDLPIHILITSDGGDVQCGLDIYDALLQYHGGKTGTVGGFARSMGSLILQACEHRQCTKHSRILIHHISKRSISLDTLRNSRELKHMIKSMELSQSHIYKILSKRTGKSIEEIGERCAENKDMSAEEALKFGLVDEII